FYSWGLERKSMGIKIGNKYIDMDNVERVTQFGNKLEIAYYNHKQKDNFLFPSIRECSHYRQLLYTLF
ncbi:MAG: hypothetical protein AAF518_19510, partial [Spirochaetota bacterium]